MFKEFCNLVKEMGSDTLKLGSDLTNIWGDAFREFIDDPIGYTVESAEEIADFAGALVMSDCSSKQVKPVIGSIVYCRMLGGLAEHSGVYVGKGMVVHLNGFGMVEKVRFNEFVYCMNGLGQSHDIYVSSSSSSNKAVGKKRTAERAEEAIGTFKEYDMISENCHQFVSGCITGNFDNGDNLMGFLKHTCKRAFLADRWNLFLK